MPIDRNAISRRKENESSLLPVLPQRVDPTPTLQRDRVNVPSIPRVTPIVPINRNPWDLYTKIMDVRLGGDVTLACRNPTTTEIFAIRSIAGLDSEVRLHMLDQIRHHSFLETKEVFVFDGCFLVVSAYMDLSVDEMISSPLELQEREIAVIIDQVHPQLHDWKETLTPPRFFKACLSWQLNV